MKRMKKNNNKNEEKIIYIVEIRIIRTRTHYSSLFILIIKARSDGQLAGGAWASGLQLKKEQILDNIARTHGHIHKYSVRQN